jgi:broad specificity phosphatase PhoE
MLLTFVFVRNAESMSEITHKNGFATSGKVKSLKENKYNFLNIPLTRTGESQAQFVGNSFLNMYFSKESTTRLTGSKTEKIQVHSSHSKNATDTQKIFLSKFKDSGLLAGTHSSLDNKLREKDPGEAFFLSKKEFVEKYPNSLYPQNVNSYFLVPPGGESIASRESDVKKFIQDISETPFGNIVISFTHSSFLMALEKLFRPEEESTFLVLPPNNCAIYLLKGEVLPDSTFRCTEFKKIDYLETLKGSL